jgi:hypothetical protein
MTQEAVEKNSPGATIVPVIISTNKTQLTLFRNKSAYPVYLTIGNIPKEIRRKPSAQAYILLGYLPTTHLETVTNKAARQRMISNLYHSCMGQILKPLQKLGEHGTMMTTTDGHLRRIHPIIAAFIGDYPEQVLTTCLAIGLAARYPVLGLEIVVLSTRLAALPMCLKSYPFLMMICQNLFAHAKNLA